MSYLRSYRKRVVVDRGHGVPHSCQLPSFPYSRERTVLTLCHSFSILEEEWEGTVHRWLSNTHTKNLVND